MFAEINSEMKPKTAEIHPCAWPKVHISTAPNAVSLGSGQAANMER
jgi:hypothetical protein